MSSPYSPPSVNEVATRPVNWCRLGGGFLVVTGLTSAAICAYVPHHLPLPFAGYVMLVQLLPGMVMVVASLPNSSRPERRWKTLAWLLLPVLASVMIAATAFGIRVIHDMRFQQRVQAAEDRHWRKTGLPDHLRPILDRTFEQ